MLQRVNSSSGSRGTNSNTSRKQYVVDGSSNFGCFVVVDLVLSVLMYSQYIIHLYLGRSRGSTFGYHRSGVHCIECFK